MLQIDESNIKKERLEKEHHGIFGIANANIPRFYCKQICYFKQINFFINLYDKIVACIVYRWPELEVTIASYSAKKQNSAGQRKYFRASGVFFVSRANIAAARCRKSSAFLSPLPIQRLPP